ncbi:metalloregulator ArsR/SmtB family transcription factor [Ramlibacter solisilvae]|uniref:ArsR family transcriptional regulator n=1 Tax=Ramlibacter tataouinensis TaxID=94132 RepID=A0A127JPQ3_9BURK|nr:metalloregulator ArsR/SmtB family transcription factor [Ramlibacter tataouinensis]AMO22008.1 ArsR family transcriptional regulator [Ramlibacter tataouinensis]
MSPNPPEAAVGLFAPSRSPAELAPVFFALGDATRLRLVALLCAGGAFSIAQLTAHTHISRQAVTKHLQVLADAGLVHDLRAGRERLWQFDPAQLEQARQSLEIIGRQWEAALGRLKASIEG